MIKMLKFVVILLWTLSSIEAYNILVIIPTPNVGQWYYMEEFVRALLSSGHTVTSIGCYGARSKHEGHTQIFVRSFDVEDHCKSDEVVNNSNSMLLKNIEEFRYIFL